jgi:hypothetical protein
MSDKKKEKECNPYRIFVDSLEKAVTVDGATSFFLSGVTVKLPITVGAAFLAYAGRSYARCDGDQYPGGAIAGAMKYYLTDQNPMVGALNTMTYEYMNDNAEAYGIDSFTDVAISIMAVEGSDAYLQAAIKNGYMIDANFAKKGFKGAMAGVVAANCYYNFYKPLSEFTDKYLFSYEE